MRKTKPEVEVSRRDEERPVSRPDCAQREVGVLRSHLRVTHASTSVEIASEISANADSRSAILEAIRVPTNAQPFGSATALMAELTKIVLNYSGLTGHYARLAAFWMCMTWVVDAGTIAPRLSVFGPSSRGADQLMQLLALCSRHPLPLTCVSPAAFLSLPFSFRLTLLIQQKRVKPAVAEILDAATRVQFIHRKGQLIKPFAPIALRTDQPLGNSLDIPMIEVPVWPVESSPPLLHATEAELIATRFQGQLLSFREKQLRSTRASTFDPAELTSPAREVGRALGSCFSDPALQAEIVTLLREADAHSRVARATDPYSLLVEALLFHCHESCGKTNAGIHAGQLARTVQTISTGRGQEVELGARAIGNYLRALGLETTKLDRNGRGVLLCREIVERVHQIAADRRVPSIAGSASRCAQCKQILEPLEQPVLTAAAGTGRSTLCTNAHRTRRHE